MTYRAKYSYAWDIAEVGISVFGDEIRALGLDTVTLAGSYHAGKCLRPHGKGKVGLFGGRHHASGFLNGRGEMDRLRIGVIGLGWFGEYSIAML